MSRQSEVAGGAVPRVFPSTHWSLVLRAGRRVDPAASEALEQLCRAYWFPLYAFARRCGYVQETAQDLTQEFFSRLLAKDYLQAADPNRGRFRSFLLASFKHMMARERRDAARLKRGGRAQTFSLDALHPEERYAVEPADELAPDRVFERRWAEALLARTLERLKSEYTDRALRFEELKVFLVGARGAAPLAETAARLGVGEGALKLVVYRMRQRYAQIFREEVAQTVEDPDEVEDEIRHVFAVLAA
jgi:RNA polymerase sigma-70 factor (ECF subfamily)